MPVLANESVYQRAFSGIRTPHDCEARNGVELLVLVIGFRQVFNHFIQNVARAIAVHGRYGPRVAKAEFVELRHVVQPVGGIHLVGYQKHRLTALAQYLRHMVVEVSHAVHRVHDEQYDVGLLYCELHLLVDFALEYIV